MTDHFKKIYGQKADAYQRMIAAEDHYGYLRDLMRGLIGAYERPRVVDLGSGTGRFGVLVGDMTRDFVALDLHAAMLKEQALLRRAVDYAARWRLVHADARAVPLADGWSDVVLAGWALGHLTGWYPLTWKNEIALALREAERIARPGGLICIAETMTTGGPPGPPSAVLAEYYTWLEGEWGFERQVIQTDFAFNSIEEAVAATEFFFGEELAAKIRQKEWAIVPEWTGIWVKKT